MGCRIRMMPSDGEIAVQFLVVAALGVAITACAIPAYRLERQFGRPRLTAGRLLAYATLLATVAGYCRWDVRWFSAERLAIGFVGIGGGVMWLALRLAWMQDARAAAHGQTVSEAARIALPLLAVPGLVFGPLLIGKAAFDLVYGPHGPLGGSFEELIGTVLFGGLALFATHAACEALIGPPDRSAAGGIRRLFATTDQPDREPVDPNAPLADRLNAR